MPPDTHVEQTVTRPTPPSARKRRLLLSAAAVVVIGAVVIMAPAALRIFDDPAGSAPVAGIDEVRTRDNRYDPPVIEVTAGTTVTWHLEDAGVAHNIVGDGWQSEVLESGSFAHTFEEPGSYPYTCTLHWGMDGRVQVVQP